MCSIHQYTHTCTVSYRRFPHPTSFIASYHPAVKRILITTKGQHISRLYLRKLSSPTHTRDTLRRHLRTLKVKFVNYAQHTKHVNEISLKPSPPTITDTRGWGRKATCGGDDKEPKMEAQSVSQASLAMIADAPRVCEIGGFYPQNTTFVKMVEIPLPIFHHIDF